MSLGALLVDIAAAAIKRIRNRPKAVARRAAKAARKGKVFSDDKETPMLNGKLTYTAIAVMAIIYAGQLIGVDIAEEQAASIVGVVAGLIGAYGRWRATKAV